MTMFLSNQSGFSKYLKLLRHYTKYARCWLSKDRCQLIIKYIYSRGAQAICAVFVWPNFRTATSHCERQVFRVSATIGGCKHFIYQHSQLENAPSITKRNSTFGMLLMLYCH